MHRSSIPRDSRPRVKVRHEGGAPARVEYFKNRKCVGFRLFDPDGNIEWETPIRDGRAHGTKYVWYEPGWLTSAEPFRNGLPHGIARQWDRRGRLVGTYRMVKGTGVDLWWHDDFRGGHNVSEVYYLRNGLRHGFEWLLNDDGTLWAERHFHDGKQHGIEREWNRKRLRRGYPRFWILDERVSRREYERRAALDPELAEFRRGENVPGREFPAIVQRAMDRNRGR